jgi:hypothetical protein
LSNSIPHPLYAKLPLEEQIRQTVESIRFFVEHFDLDYRAFAFPHLDAGCERSSSRKCGTHGNFRFLLEQPGCAGTFSRGTSSDLAWKTHRFQQLKSLG